MIRAIKCVRVCRFFPLWCTQEIMGRYGWSNHQQNWAPRAAMLGERKWKRSTTIQIILVFSVFFVRSEELCVRIERFLWFVIEWPRIFCACVVSGMSWMKWVRIHQNLFLCTQSQLQSRTTTQRPTPLALYLSFSGSPFHIISYVSG